MSPSPRLAAPARCLPLGAALELAVDRDPRVLGSEAREGDFAARITEAKALSRPTLSAFGRSGFGDTGVVDSSVSSQAGLQLSQRVFDFGDARLARRSARANAEASRFDTDAEKLSAARAASNAYLSYLEAKEKADQTQDRRAYFVQQLGSLDRLLEVGGATLTERATVASEISDADAFAFQLKFQMESAQIELALTTGLTSEPCANSFADNQMSSVTLVREDEVLDDNPELQALRSRAEALLAETKRQKRSRLPILSVIATGSYASVQDFDQFEYQDRVGIDVSMPLYAGNGLRAATQRASAREQQAKSDVLIAERELRQTLQITQRYIAILGQQLDARREAKNQKAILLKAAEDEQSAGTLTFRELIEIRLDYEQSVVTEISTRYELARQKLELDFIKGDVPGAPNAIAR
jgi:protease secretion system outer membrane protein